MKSPFFSVVIPTLNEEKYLPTILRSLSKQSYRNFELIVVDANSEDKTKEAFQKFAPLFPKATFYSTPRQNVAFQRNFGAKKASGKYLVFLDADVDVGETFLEEIHIAAIKKKFNLATTWIVPDSKKAIDNLMILFANLLGELAKGIDKPFSGGYNTIVTKKTFRKLNGFREDIKISEDHDFSIRAFKHDIECVILKEPRVTYSLRRYRSEGTLTVLRKLTRGQIYNFLKGPITREIFEYKMGGHVHKIKKKKKIDLIRLDKYLRNIEKIEKKISSLIFE